MKKIIVQDFDDDIRKTIQLILEEFDFIVYATNTFENLMVEIERFKPDVLLLDFKMDGAQCIEAANQIKSFYRFLPIITMSCNRNISQLYKIHHFDDYLAKPFDIPVLLAVIERSIVLRSIK